MTKKLSIIPQILDGAPVIVQEALARRAAVTTTGRCPCGAALPMPNRAERRAARGRVLHVDVRHERDCVAIDLTVKRWLREWR